MNRLISIKTLLSAVFLLALMTCDVSRLDTPPLGDTEDTFFTGEDDFRRTLMNAYAKMTDWYWFRSGNVMHDLWHLPGDDITEDNGNYATYEIFSGVNSRSQDIAEYWDRAYELIQRVNVIIPKTEDADPDEFDDPSFLPIIRGEALFLRGFSFFKLFNMYGTAPVITARSSSETLNNPRSEGTQLLDQAIADLTTAADLLPESWDDANRGRATKASALGFLVKAYVFRGDHSGNSTDYTAAVTAFNRITSRSLMASYTDNFNGLTENNAESIFEYQASRAPGQDNVWLNNDGPWRGVETMSTYWGFFTTAENSAKTNFQGTTWKVTQKVYDAYGTDPRIAFFTDDTRSFTKYGKEGLDVITSGAGVSSQNNPRILRYAEVLLLAAEAMVRSGGSTAEAIGLINQVRTRARNWAATEALPGVTMPQDYPTSESDPTQIMDWIMEERLLELCGEENVRWWDLKRWDARGDIDLSMWDGSDAYFSTDLSATFQFEYPTNLVWPIPQDEIERNSAIISNNPGY